MGRLGNREGTVLAHEFEELASSSTGLYDGLSRVI